MLGKALIRKGCRPRASLTGFVSTGFPLIWCTELLHAGQISVLYGVLHAGGSGSLCQQ